MNNLKLVILLFAIVIAIVIASQIKTAEKKIWKMPIINVSENQPINQEINLKQEQKIKLPNR